MKPMMKLCLCLHKFSELWNLFSIVPTVNCFWFYFSQLLMYLAVRTCENDCKILKIILVQIFCPLMPEIGQFSVGFRLKLFIFLFWYTYIRRETPGTTSILLNEFEKLAAMVHVLQTTHNLVISRCCFTEDGKEISQEL